jgi:hypothetical protein
VQFGYFSWLVAARPPIVDPLRLRLEKSSRNSWRDFIENAPICEG